MDSTFREDDASTSREVSRAYQEGEMTKEEIIRIAYEAGLVGKPSENATEFLEAFAALVAASEREACAEVGKYALPNHSDLGLVVEAAIRARGQA